MTSAIILSDNGVSSGSAGIKSSGGNDGTLLLQTTTSGGTATTAVLMDNAQNVGVGVTPSAWGTANKAVEFGYAAFASNNSGATYTTANVYFNNSSQWIYKSTAAASLYQQSSGGHYLFGAASGTSGTAASFTQIFSLAKGQTLTLEGGTQTAGTGIAFPATQSASSDVNTLDDYEKGTWTPALNATGMTYSAQVGTYTKVGRAVTLQFYLTFTTWSSAAGDVVITGLPFAALPTTGAYQEISVPYFTGVTLPAGCTVLGGEIGISTSTIYLYGMGSALSGYSKLQYGTAITNTGSAKLLLATFTYQSA